MNSAIIGLTLVGLFAGIIYISVAYQYYMSGMGYRFVPFSIGQRRIARDFNKKHLKAEILVVFLLALFFLEILLAALGH